MPLFFFMRPILEAKAEILQNISFAFWARSFKKIDFLTFKFHGLLASFKT